MHLIQKRATSNNVEISEKAISFNIRQILSMVPDLSKIHFVLKANAYGHGINTVIRQLMHHDCTNVALESSSAACQIRKIGFKGEILILHPIADPDIHCCLENEFTITVNRLEQLPMLENECLKMNKFCKIHLKLDIGLHRIGSTEQMICQIAEAATKQ